jgi:hypothetical protein
MCGLQTMRPQVEPEFNVSRLHNGCSTGFETFSNKVHQIVTQEGEACFYVLDCLSDLLSAWAND